MISNYLFVLKLFCNQNLIEINFNIQNLKIKYLHKILNSFNFVIKF